MKCKENPVFKQEHYRKIWNYELKGKTMKDWHIVLENGAKVCLTTTLESADGSESYLSSRAITRAIWEANKEGKFNELFDKYKNGEIKEEDISRDLFEKFEMKLMYEI